MDLVEKFSLGETDKEITITKIKVTDRNKLFKKYLNLNKFMVDKEKNKDVNLLEYVNDNESILDFMFEVLKTSISGITFNDLTSEQSDELFNKYGTFILGGDSKN